MFTPTLIFSAPSASQVLTIDEADRILEIGFEEDMRAIIRLLPTANRQTALFSATQTQNVADLARLAIQHKPVYVAAQESSESSTVLTLEQGFVVCEPQNRFLLLFTFLKKNRKKKVIVFFSSCNSVRAERPAAPAPCRGRDQYHAPARSS